MTRYRVPEPDAEVVRRTWIYAGGDALLRLPGAPLWVLSLPTETANRANAVLGTDAESLRAVMTTWGWTIIDTITSHVGWMVPSLTVGGASDRDTVLGLARQYELPTVFELTDADQILVSTQDGKVLASVPRRRAIIPTTSNLSSMAAALVNERRGDPGTNRDPAALSRVFKTVGLVMADGVSEECSASAMVVSALVEGVNVLRGNDAIEHDDVSGQLGVVVADLVESCLALWQNTKVPWLERTSACVSDISAEDRPCVLRILAACTWVRLAEFLADLRRLGPVTWELMPGVRTDAVNHYRKVAVNLVAKMPDSLVVQQLRLAAEELEKEAGLIST